METIASKVLGEYGVIPLIVVIIVILWFFYREIKKEVGSVKISLNTMSADFSMQLNNIKTELEKRLQELEKRSDEKDEEVLNELRSLQDEVKYIEREYVRREDHYKDLGGWRTDFRKIQDRVDAIYEGMAKWKN